MDDRDFADMEREWDDGRYEEDDIDDSICPQCNGDGTYWDMPCDKCDGMGRLF